MKLFSYSFYLIINIDFAERIKLTGYNCFIKVNGGFIAYCCKLAMANADTIYIKLLTFSTSSDRSKGLLIMPSQP